MTAPAIGRGNCRAVSSSGWPSPGPSSRTPPSWSATNPPAISIAKNAEEILDLLQILNRDYGKTVIMVTHDPKAADHAKRVLHLDKGKLVREMAA